MDLGLLLSLGMMTLPTIPVLVYQLRKTKRALAAGYRLSDLRFALRTWSAERIGELDRGRETRLVRIASWIPLQSALPVSHEFSRAVLVPSVHLACRRCGEARRVRRITSLAGLSVFGLPLVPKWLQRRMIGRARGWLWNSKFGSWLADRLAPKGGGVPLAAFRPTEMALEVAIDDLFAALPDEYRDSLHDLPAIARRLTARAAELREALTIDVGPEGDPDHTWQKTEERELGAVEGDSDGARAASPRTDAAPWRDCRPSPGHDGARSRARGGPGLDVSSKGKPR